MFFMKKGTLISIIALIAALAGIGIAVYALIRRSGCMLCDSFDDDMLSDDLYEEDDEDEEPAEAEEKTEEKTEE